MLRWLIERRLAAAERELGGSMDYARHMARTSLPACLAFAKFPKLAAYRRSLPADVRCVARLAIVLTEDCGECAQIEVNMARDDGVSVEIISAVLEARPELLQPSLRDVYAFASAIAAGQDAPDARARLSAAMSEEQMTELALVLSTASVYPRLRRALGFAKACAAVRVSAARSLARD